MIDFFKNLFSKKQKHGEKTLCECTGDVSIKIIREYSSFPLMGGHHTSFIVGECLSCKGLTAFPKYNLLLAIKEGDDYAKQSLKELGLADKVLWPHKP